VSLAKLPATTAIPVPSWADSRTKSCFVVSRDAVACVSGEEGIDGERIGFYLCGIVVGLLAIDVEEGGSARVFDDVA